TLPFKMVAAPWIDGQELSRRMNALKIPGVEFRPISAKPFYSTFKGENVSGIEIYVTDKEQAPLALTQFYIMQELADMYPDKKAFDIGDKTRYKMFDKVTGSPEIRARFTKNYRVDDIIDYWTKDEPTFKIKKAKYHLY
ncbi:MAG: DUF1343 domain-containing protein, partial [Muribaculaceae bacterium]|nr:DUF1343 domain-containing protein [Muribaculaceae bacterium]